MNRRDFIIGAASLPVLSAPALAAASEVQVFKSPTCGCCSAWVEHMAKAGFAVDARDVDQDALDALKDRLGVAPELRSCHTAWVAGYFIEGHVPAEDVMRLILDGPEALGLAVPGMPIGSPGMEMGDQRDAYETLLARRDGRIEVFARHG